MNEQEIKRKFPRASKSFVEANADGLPSGAKPQQNSGNELLAKNKGEAENPTRRLVSITSYRVRLLDVDNLMGKWHLDSLRYAGVIKDDSVKHIVYQIRQRKVEKRAQEKTLIEVT